MCGDLLMYVFYFKEIEGNVNERSMIFSMSQMKCAVT